MKKLLILAVLLGISLNCFADVIATFKGARVGERDYIWLDFDYNIDGKVISNSYPMDIKNYVGKTNAEIVAWIKNNIEYQCDRYIEAEFRKKSNQQAITDKLNTLTGKSFTKTTADLLFDTNNNNLIDTKWTVKTDGSYTTSSVTE